MLGMEQLCQNSQVPSLCLCKRTQADKNKCTRHCWWRGLQGLFVWLMAMYVVSLFMFVVSDSCAGVAGVVAVLAV
jgi:hypothetical protein